MNWRAGEEYSLFRAELSPVDHQHGCGWHITDIASGVRCHSGGVGRGCTAPCRTFMWSAVNLVAKYADFSHCCIAWDAVNGVSHVTYKTVYNGSAYTRVLNFGHFLTVKKGAQLMCGSTCTRVHTVHCICHRHKSEEPFLGVWVGWPLILRRDWCVAGCHASQENHSVDLVCFQPLNEGRCLFCVGCPVTVFSMWCR